VRTLLDGLARLGDSKTKRCSSWDVDGRNKDFWIVEPGETRALADIAGPGAITHIWMVQNSHYREVLIRITYDDSPAPSVLSPLGDFFGRGHFIGCNLSITNFQGTCWGEGDDMIWVDGYKWPPELHGTGSEDYLSQVWGMQPNAFLRSGSSIHERHTHGYQTSYVHHVENPVRFTKELKVTIEQGHGNHLAHEVSSVACWYAEEPAAAIEPPPVEKRLPVLRDNKGTWLIEEKNQVTSRVIEPNDEMKSMKARWTEKQNP
jgi:hypothetical protein